MSAAMGSILYDGKRTGAGEGCRETQTALTA